MHDRGCAKSTQLTGKITIFCRQRSGWTCKARTRVEHPGNRKYKLVGKIYNVIIKEIVAWAKHACKNVPSCLNAHSRRVKFASGWTSLKNQCY